MAWQTPLRGTDEWTAWLEKWRNYARAELRDSAADDPDFDFGLLTTEERWRVILKLEIQRQIAQGMGSSYSTLTPRNVSCVCSGLKNCS